MYSLADYGEMISDTARFGAYARAIKQAVRPGSTVVDIGCGPGVFALLACRAGARRVYAIESEDIIQFAKQLTATNRFADRVEFFQSDSRSVNLPERMDVLVSDLRGVLPMLGPAIASIEDARQRFLASDGVLIPQRDLLKAAVIESKQRYDQLVSPWRAAVDGLDLSLALSMLLNTNHGHHFKREQFLTKPQTWTVLDYTKGVVTHLAGDLQFRAERNGTAHGLCIWFEAHLLDDIGFSAGPEGASTVYGQLFLPWLEPVKLQEGQSVHVKLHADFVGDDYVWRWETSVPACDGASAKHFQQSTFQGSHLSSHSLRCRSADFIPELSPEGQADRWLAQAMDGRASLGEIAQSALTHFPQIFARWDDALRRAGELADKLSR